MYPFLGVFKASRNTNGSQYCNSVLFMYLKRVYITPHEHFLSILPESYYKGIPYYKALNVEIINYNGSCHKHIILNACIHTRKYGPISKDAWIHIIYSFLTMKVFSVHTYFPVFHIIHFISGIIIISNKIYILIFKTDCSSKYFHIHLYFKKASISISNS